jgi:hypothetical protein
MGGEALDPKNFTTLILIWEGCLSLGEALDLSALEAHGRALKMTDQRYTATSMPKRNPATHNIRRRPR